MELFPSSSTNGAEHYSKFSQNTDYSKVKSELILVHWVGETSNFASCLVKPIGKAKVNDKLWNEQWILQFCTKN